MNSEHVHKINISGIRQPLTAPENREGNRGKLIKNFILISISGSKGTSFKFDFLRFDFLSSIKGNWITE